MPQPSPGLPRTLPELAGNTLKRGHRPVRLVDMRRLLKPLLVLVALVTVAAIGLGGFIAWSFVSAKEDTVGKVEFDRPLAVPPLAKSHVDAQGRRVFDLTLQRGESDFGRGGPTPTWGINGDYLGPTLRARRGEKVLVNVTNDLGETSTIHWHGMHLPAAMDGGPHQPIEPGETWSPSWRIDQPAATLWYHPHPHGETAQHVYRGLAGLFYVDDAARPRLPSTYGVDDVPLIVQDKEFDGNRFDTSHGLFESTGILGDTILVNGTPGPYLDVTTQRVRLRILNASNARIYDFAFDDGREYDVVGTDGGLLPEPVPVTHLDDVEFQIASIDGQAPPAYLRGWKDTVFLPPGREVELLLHFADYADPDAPYMFHGHLLRHEDSGMMGQFVVVRPGEKPGSMEGMGMDH